jgi:outer membrane murein-binding lipoprotein Lpp
MIMNKTFVLTAIALASISLSGCKDQTRTKTESKESAVLTDGTKIETTSETEVKVDEHGNRTSTSETKTTVDPEGMMNKETTTETHEEAHYPDYQIEVLQVSILIQKL